MVGVSAIIPGSVVQGRKAKIAGTHHVTQQLLGQTLARHLDRILGEARELRSVVHFDCSLYEVSKME